MKPSRSVPLSYVLPDWMRVPVLPIFVATEIRAIFPAWVLAMLLVAIAPLLGEGLNQIVLRLGYGIGCAVLGSIAVGHDFIHRTLGTTLSLPFPRGRLWWTRLMVSLAGMIPLAALAGVQLLRFSHISIRDLTGSGIAIFAIPVLSGVFVAPWLTLLCRGALAGTVFTACLPGLLWMVSELTVTARFGEDASVETQKFQTGVFGLLLVIHWVAGGFFGWRKFMRLEAIEGRVGELHLPRWLRRQSPAKSTALTPKRGQPLWLLLKKELRLQQMAFVTASLYLLVSLCLWELHQLRPDLDSVFIDVPSQLYVGLLSILIGSVASSEERQLGTAEWQVLLPMAARKQWAVKVGTVLGLVVLLSAFLPAYVLHRVSWGNGVKDGVLPLAIYFAGFATALATMSLYFSSLCNNGLKAMLISLPAGAGMLALIGFARHHYADVENALHSRRAYFGEGPWDWLVAWLPLALLVGLFLLTLRFALLNHRSAERGAARIWRQIACLIAYVALSAALCYNVVFLYAADDQPNQEAAQAPPSLPTPTTLAQIPPGMNVEMMKRYGLIPKDALVQIATNAQDFPNIQVPSTSPAESTTNRIPTGMSIEIMKRYGLVPPNATIPAATNSPGSRK